MMLLGYSLILGLAACVVCFARLACGITQSRGFSRAVPVEMLSCLGRIGSITEC